LAALALGCLIPLTAVPAPADAKLFTWTLTGPAPGLGGVPFPGGGTITATLTSSPGVWDITAITGTINGSWITGLNTFEGANNELFTNGYAFLSTSGLGFETAASQMINIFSFYSQGSPPSGNAYGEISSNPSAFGVGTFTATAVPELSTWAMMLTGFAGLAYAGYRRASVRPAV
jgi:hypothetical protein